MAPPYASPYALSFLLLLLSVPAVFLLAPRLLLPRTLPAIPDADETEDLALFRRRQCRCSILAYKTPSWFMDIIHAKLLPAAASALPMLGPNRVNAGAIIDNN